MENSIEALSVAHPAPYLSPSSDCNLRRVRRRFSVAVDDGSESEQSWIDDAADGDSSSSYDSPHLSFNTLPAPIALSSAFNPFCMSRDSIDQNGPFRMEAMSYSGLDQLFNQDDDLPSPSMLEIINSPLTSPSPVSSLSPTDTESEADTPEPSSHNDQHTQQQNLSFPPSFSMVSMQTSSSDDDSSSSSVSVSSVGSSSKHSASVSVLCTDHWPSEYRAKAHSVLRPSSDGWYDCTMCFIPRADQYSHRTIYIHHDYLRLECSDGGALRGGCHRDLSRAMNDRGLTHRQELESRIEETRALLKNPDQVKGKRKKGNSESIIQQANNRLHMLERLLYALMNADCDIALLHHRDGDRPIIIPARLRKDDCRKTNRLLYHAKIKFANKLENDRPVVEALRIVDSLLKE